MSAAGSIGGGEAEEAPRRCRLYLITPPVIASDQFSDDLRAAMSGGDVAVLQLRLKDVSDEAIRAAAQSLAPITRAAGIALLMNDRPDLASDTDCDGVHIGQDDAPYADARRLLGQDGVVGVTCKNSRHLAVEAADAGADYVAFGAFFPTETKTPSAWAEPEILAWWSETTNVPCVAIGGITVENCAPLVAAGADFLAVSGGVWRHPDGPEAAVRGFNEVFESHVR